MKQLYLKCLLFGILSQTGIKSYAYDCYVDGIYYNLNQTDNTASVTYQKRSTHTYYGTVTVIYNSDYTGNVTIPSSFTYGEITYHVTSIGDHAFIGCYSLASVTIPSNVNSIGEQAFYGCNDLTSIDIPNSVTTIGSCTFQNCI